MSKTSQGSQSGKITLKRTFKESANGHTEKTTKFILEPSDNEGAVRLVYSYQEDNFIDHDRSRKKTEVHEIPVEELINFIKSKGSKK